MKEMTEWISLKDEEPKNKDQGKWFSVLINKIPKTAQYLVYCGECDFIVRRFDIPPEWAHPTHWMLLPETPK